MGVKVSPVKLYYSDTLFMNYFCDSSLKQQQHKGTTWFEKIVRKYLF